MKRPRAACRLVIAFAVTGVWPAISALAQEKQEKDEAKKAPSIRLLVPWSVPVGATTKVAVRGLNLGETSEVKLQNSSATAKIVSKGGVSVPDKLEAAKVGDSQVEVEFAIPADFAADQLEVAVVTPTGESGSKTLRIVRPEQLLEEKESNGGFHEAQPVQVGQTIEGVIKNPRDVEVFRIEGKSGQRLIIELVAAALGSPCDGLLTLHRQDGAILASSDDHGGSSDPRLEFTPTEDGLFYLSLVDAHDLGSPLHQYRLTVRRAD